MLVSNNEPYDIYMNKQETIVVVVLISALVAWFLFIKPDPQIPEAVVADAGLEQTNSVAGEAHAGSTVVEPALVEVASKPVNAEPEKPVKDLQPETKLALTNLEMVVNISSHGGSISSVSLNDYSQTLAEDSENVSLDFSAKKALALSDIPGLAENDNFDVSFGESDNSASITKTTLAGLKFERIITMQDGYLLKIKDVFLNTGAGVMELPAHSVGIGPMQMIESKSKTRGISYLDINTLASAAGENVVYWTKSGPDGRKDISISKLFEPEYRRGGGCSMFKPKIINPYVASTNIVIASDSDWVAAKNKFFVQILDPVKGCNGYKLNVKRQVPETEVPENPKTWSKTPVLQEVSADIHFDERVLQPGDSFVREMNYYVGPKKYSAIKALGNHQDKIMFRAWPGFGWFRSICVLLLWTLNAIFMVVRNYGVAIILLTVIVKVIFWPITHKSTENMKKMQEIQPQVKDIREKHKDDPQKMNLKIMALYKEKKVNPMMGCLPMFIQIPVFIGLFTMLRSAVELRFADFLWIKDLSEPEGLFAGSIPIVGSLNILPLVMTATMVLQQKLTPSAGDPQQKKMMQMMSVFFLFIFYSMPSALVLYWSVSQGLSILQLVMQQRKKKDDDVELVAA